MSINPRIAPPKVKGQRALAGAKSAVTDENEAVSGTVRAATARAANAVATENEGMHRLRDLKVADDASANREFAYAKSTSPLVTYSVAEGVHRFIKKVQDATPMQLMDIEREGVHGRLLKDIAQEMDIPSSRLFTIIGVPKATAEKKASSNEVIAGAGGQAALGLIRLLGIAQNIVHNSTAATARDFDAAKWLGRWIERPQPALGGNKPADLLDTPTGLQVVSRTLGAIESGAYL